ncbi:MAG: Zn-ribbon domain-containing OB-fold protein [Thermoprotei archaeon]
MYLPESLRNMIQAKNWVDSLPLNYKYSAGVSGQRFAEGLKQGKILGSKCNRCGETFLPPSLYCPKCYVYTSEYVEVQPNGEIYTFTEVDGRVVALIKFPGVNGGLIHTVKKPSAGKIRIGLRVSAVFRPTEQRKGDIADIEFFEIRPHL